MTMVSFLTMLSAFAVISGLVVEAAKKIVPTLTEKSTNIVALVVALIIGTIGTLVYYQLGAIPFTVNNIIYAVLMGLASGLVSMVGYDKVKQAIEQLGGK